MCCLSSLGEMFSGVADPRQASKVRHPLCAVLLQCFVAVLCGCRGPRAISEWGRSHPELSGDLGYGPGAMPCAATFSRVLSRLDWSALVSRVQEWVEELMPVMCSDRRPALALDGKTLRGSQKRGADGSHVLAAVLHGVGFSLSEAAVDAKTNEIPVAEELLQRLRLCGRVVTVDALLTQRKLADTILEAEGDYVMPVKENHPALRREIDGLFRDAKRLDASFQRAQTVEVSHGRQECRTISVSTELADYVAEVFGWPGLEQVYRIEREVTRTRGGPAYRQTEYGLTSLSAEEAKPEDLLRLRRQHWHIENRLHWVRDVTYDEDRSQVRSGNAHRVMATFRNLAIGVLRLTGHRNIAAANRRLAAEPCHAWRLTALAPS